MSKSAPDTRNKLDSNKGLKRQPKKTNLKEIKEVLDGSKLKFTPKETKGMIFKRIMGYSKSTDRAMNRAGVVTLEAYKEIRKARKLLERKARQKKHADSTAYKRANGKKKGSKGSKPANKVTK